MAVLHLGKVALRNVGMGWGHRDQSETFDLRGVEHGLCVLPSSQVYVADTGNQRIRNFCLTHARRGAAAGRQSGPQ